MPHRGQEGGISRPVACFSVCLCPLFPLGPLLHWVCSCVWVPCAAGCSPGLCGRKEQKASREQRQIPSPSSLHLSRDEEVGDVPGNVCGERLRRVQVVDLGNLDAVLDRSWAGQFGLEADPSTPHPPAGCLALAGEGWLHLPGGAQLWHR